MSGMELVHASVPYQVFTL